MQDSSQYDDDVKIFNLVQVLALNVVLTVSLVVALKALGNSWLVAISGAWMGGSILTLGTVFALYALHSVFSRGAGTVFGGAYIENGPALVPTNINDPMQVWETDRLMEIDHASANEAVDGTRKPRRQSPIEMVRMWDADSDVEAGENFVAPKRPVRSDRRQTEVPFVGNERRTVSR